MNISRHNYEEFFLLYVDNELSAKERNAVELFVQQNPDLGKELHLIQQSIISHDEIIFDDKQSLLREDSGLALQENLLLFVDGELTFEESEKMVALLSTNNAAAAEWKILQQTKLQPESIVFEDKRSLYRTEGGRMIGIKWWRVAAAAVLLGFGIWLGTNVFRTGKKTDGTEVQPIANGKTDQPQQNSSIVSPTSVQPLTKGDSANETVRITAPQKEQEQTAPEKNNLVKSNEIDKTVKDKLLKQNNVKLKEDHNIVKEDVRDKKPNNNLPKPNLEDLNKPGSNKEDVVIVQPKTSDKINNLQRPVDNKADVAVTNKEKQIESVKKPIDINEGPPTNIPAKNALYNESDENKNDTRILYMDEDKVSRTKIGGIFRRLKRVVERTTNIKTGNSVKVAGFEIAIK